MFTGETFLNLTGARRLPLVRQAEAAECAIACLAMICGWYGYDVDLGTLRRRYPVSLKGTTARTLLDIGGRVGLAGRAVRCELSDLRHLRLPCILHWQFNHLVVLQRVGNGEIWIHDPALGRRRCGLTEVSRSFTGVAIEFTPTEGFEVRRDRQPLRLSQLVRWSPVIRSSLLQGLVLSLFLELFVLLNPFYMQLVIDQAILKSDRDLMLSLGVAFGTLVLFNAAANALRGLVFQHLANVVSFEMGARLFHHLIRLPLVYFHKRSLGDLFQRFHSLEPIKQIIINGGISVIIDGSLAILTCLLMLTYSLKLGSIAIGVFLVYVLLRAGFLSVGLRYAADLNVAEAREQGCFLETMRSAQTIKVCAGETDRERRWQNAYAQKINSSIKIGNWLITFQSVNAALSGLSDIGIVYLAALDTMSGSMTIGVLTAFMAYKGQFMSRMVSLIDQLIQFKMAAVPLERVADIALTSPERGVDSAPDMSAPLQGCIEGQKLSFRYSEAERNVIDAANLKIEPGEFVVIVGASGAGKTTLLKLLLGMYEPTAGQLFIDGRDRAVAGLSGLRRQIGVVMQEDQLLSGTIAENVALFEERIDFQRVRECAAQAQIDADIMALPMQYDSLIGDMGSALSCGQRQRVLIARALYRNPRILVLDEATVHIDPDRERAVVRMLRSLNITRIAATHSREMMDAADRVVELRDGRVYVLSGRAEPLARLAGNGAAHVLATSGAPGGVRAAAGVSDGREMGEL